MPNTGHGIDEGIFKFSDDGFNDFAREYLNCGGNKIMFGRHQKRGRYLNLVILSKQ